MRNYLKIAQGVDVTPLALELHQHPELWNQNTERLHPSGPHADSDDIWIRMNDRHESDAAGNWEHFNDRHESIWYPGFYALPSIRKIVFDLARRVEAEQIGDIMIWRLKPGQRLLPHTDKSWHVGFYDKFNVCISSAPGCSFVYADERMEDRPGEVHRFINTVDHHAVNTSSEDYIVMVVCLRVHDYERRYKP
jgi:hypothetical protein